MFERPDDLDKPPEIDRCTWRGCSRGTCLDTPVCLEHAIKIYGRLKDALLVSAPPIDRAEHFVYYLMIGPSTVKIGTTTGLLKRLTGLRTDLQYVVALERGGHDLETKRHRQFHTERIGLREDFCLSNRLKAHIDSLRPSRDELVALAVKPKVFDKPM